MATPNPTEQTSRAEYDQARTLAFQEFCRSEEGSAVYKKTFPILLTFHKHTDPHSAHAAAHQATLARMEQHDFQFLEFAQWLLDRQGISTNEAA